ncbi:g10302 [Coccomyxa viridis]|uniref:G10302 protein n=1 Tax=Coccomyxa viridis TaxID=1274662 RepID=A0ABP1G501_9CHLO
MAAWGKGFRKTVKQNLGFRGGTNIAAWAVAGVAAYYLWIKPERQAELERKAARERSVQRAKERGWEEVERRRPLPDPQDTGLLRGSKKN